MSRYSGTVVSKMLITYFSNRGFHAKSVREARITGERKNESRGTVDKIGLDEILRKINFVYVRKIIASNVEFLVKN